MENEFEKVKQQACSLGYDLIRRLDNLPEMNNLPPYVGWHQFHSIRFRDLFSVRVCGIYIIAESKEPPLILDETEPRVIYIGQTSNLMQRLSNFWRHARTGKGTHWGANILRATADDELEARLNRMYFAFRSFPWEDRSILPKLEKQLLKKRDILPVLNGGGKK